MNMYAHTATCKCLTAKILANDYSSDLRDLRKQFKDINR